MNANLNRKLTAVMNLTANKLRPRLTPFHVAVQVRCLHEARAFYVGTLGCDEGRSDQDWIDFDLFGHQFVCHFNPHIGKSGKIANFFNEVDAKSVPIPHFGVILEMTQWKRFAQRLQRQGIEFIIDPYIRFQGQPGEQATMFFLDPSGNALEFKSFHDMRQIFKSHNRSRLTVDGL